MTRSSYLAIDPGAKKAGWATFDDKGNVLDKGIFEYTDLHEALSDLVHSDLIKVICEDYRNHGFTQQKRWSRNETSKMIGAIETYCAMRGLEIVLQSNTKKPMGYMYAGLEPPSNHDISHDLDAYAHGVYYLQINGIRPVGKTLMERNKND